MNLKTILGGVFAVVAVAVVLALAARRPDNFTVERSVSVHAPPIILVPLINDFHNWPQWAPQDLQDAAMVRTYGGSPAGVGATSDWKGKGNTGQGRLTIIEETPLRIVVQADWQRPFKTSNQNEFALVPTATGTNVTWTVSVRNLYIMRLMSLFASPDKMMGEHLESGLANLKAAAER